MYLPTEHSVIHARIDMHSRVSVTITRGIRVHGVCILGVAGIVHLGVGAIYAMFHMLSVMNMAPVATSSLCGVW